MYKWSAKKLGQLIELGRPTFADAVMAIEEGNVVFEGDNPNYRHQSFFVVIISGYPHVLVYEDRGDHLWLVTLYPSRKFAKLLKRQE